VTWRLPARGRDRWLNVSLLLSQGYRHKFLATPYFERTSVFGTATPRDLDTQMLEQWIRTLDEDGIACQQCSGELRDSQDDNNTNIRYCDIYLEDQCAKFP